VFVFLGPKLHVYILSDVQDRWNEFVWWVVFVLLAEMYKVLQGVVPEEAAPLPVYMCAYDNTRVVLMLTQHTLL